MTLENAYAVNSAVKFTATFTVAGVATDPTTITLTIKDPSGTSTAYTYAGSDLTKDSTGVYHRTMTLSTAGTYYYAFKGTGTVVAQMESHLFVNPTDV